ncbi:MAG: hypothetical protein RIS64_724 [Bacteroidota bacterium]|jgi:hypothetical protein
MNVANKQLTSKFKWIMLYLLKIIKGGLKSLVFGHTWRIGKVDLLKCFF